MRSPRVIGRSLSERYGAADAEAVVVLTFLLALETWARELLGPSATAEQIGALVAEKVRVADLLRLSGRAADKATLRAIDIAMLENP